MSYRGNRTQVKKVYDRVRRAAYTKLKQLYPELTSEDKFYRFIRLYKAIYQGFSADAKEVYKGRKFTLEGGYTNYDKKTINAAKMVSSRMVKLSFSEKTNITIDNAEKELIQQGDKKVPTQKLNEWFQKQIKANQLLSDLIKYGERSFYAIGGIAATPRVIDGMVEFDFTDADLYIPLSWRKGRITECVTAEILRVKQVYYLLVIEHTIEIADNGDTIATETSRMFKGDKQGTSFTKDVKDIDKVLPGYADIEYSGINEIFTVYSTNAMTNSKDYDTPLGMSVFGDATDTLTCLAEAMDVFYSEMKNGRKRIVVPTQLLKERTDPTTGKPIKWFDASSDVYQAFNSNSQNAEIKDMTTVLRVTDILNAIQGLLNILAVEVGESAGTYTFNSESGAITATEVISKNSDTFKTKKLHEQKWSMFLEKLIKKTLKLVEMSVDSEALETVEDVMPEVNWDDLKITVEFDDSIVVDDKANREEARVEVGQGLMSKYTYLTEERNMSHEDAMKELERIRKEDEEDMLSVTGGGGGNNDPLFEQCVLKKMAEGKDEESAKRSCRNQKQE
jgi:A118 family predicted phage portal protein